MGWLENEQKRITRNARRWKLQPGDFVQRRDEFGDVWHEVAAVYGDSLSIYVHRSTYDRGPIHATDYTFTCYLRRRHRKGKPWKRGECRIVMDSTGKYGDRHSPPLPAQYL